MTWIRLLKITGLLAVIYVISIPLLSRTQSNFGITEGLFLLGFILLGYGILGIRSLVLQPDTRGYRLDRFDMLLLVALPLYLIYFGNERFLSSLDTTGTRLLPVAMLQKGTMDLSTQRAFMGKNLPYAVVEVQGQKLSTFPLGTALMAVPYTAVTLFAFGGDLTGERSLMAEKHFSALVCVLSAMLLLVALRAKIPESVAIKVTIVFALATGMFSCASQAMWSFTGEMFFLTLAVFLFAKMDAPSLAGFAAGAAFFCRPTALIFAGLASMIYFRTDWKRWIRFFVCCSISVCTVIVFLYLTYGHPLGGYGIMDTASSEWKSDFSTALVGNLISPSRGLLIYFPFLIFCVAGWKKPNALFVTSILSIVSILVLNSFFTKWWGGHSLGPRLLTESSLFLALLTIPIWQKSGWMKAVFIALLAFSICNQFLLVYNPAAAEWSSEVQIDEHPEILWSWQQSQFIAMWNL